MMAEDDEISQYYDSNSDTQRLLSSTTAIRKKNESNSVSPRFSIEEDAGLRIKNWQEISAKEKQLLDCVNRGDTDAVTAFIDLNRNFNFNALIDAGGKEGPQSVLHIAVARGDEPMTRLLLKIPNIEPGDAPHVAAREGHCKLITLLLDHVLHTQGAEAEQKGYPGSNHFPDDVTPLMLAASNGHVALIRLLLKRDHHIEAPHSPNCFCPEKCILRLDPQRGLRSCYERLRVYQAICNPTFVCVSADDPILKAFQLYVELKICAVKAVALGAAYEDLAAGLRAFAVTLLGYCRDNHEVEVLLSRPEGYTTKIHVDIPRLLLAMESGQKEFVAHAASQHVLYTRWLGNSPEWGGLTLLKASGRLLARIPMLPVLAVLNAVAPSSGIARNYSSPINRLINHMSSYILFLLLVFIQVNVDKRGDAAIHPPATSGLEPVIVLFLIGNEFNIFRLAALQGFRRFTGQLWNCYDVVMNHLFWMWFWFWVAAHSVQEHRERKYWPAYHPSLISEGVLAIATILAFGRLLFLCQLHHKLGPMQVSLGKMTTDLAQCFILFVIVILSFTAGLSTLFQYYDGMVQEQPGTGARLSQPGSFVDSISTMKTLFWAIFGLTPPEYAAVIIENLPDNSINTHNFTQDVGAACFALFMLLTNLMILNVLVAKMTNTYQKVVDNVGIEWTFGKSQVYISYMQQTVMPPPLNLIPTASGVSSILKWLSSLCKKKRDLEKGDEDNVLGKMETYSALMETLSKRYFCEAHTDSPPPSVPSTPVPSTTQTPTEQPEQKDELTPEKMVDLIIAQLGPMLQHQITEAKEELLTKIKRRYL